MPKGKSGLASRRPVSARVAQTISVTDMSGGQDLRRSPTLIAPNRSLEAQNWSLSEPGALVVRTGYTRYSTNSLGGTAIQGGRRVYLASTQIMLVAFNGAVYEMRDSGALNTTAVFSTVNASSQVYFPYDRTLVAVMDGNNRPRKSTDGQSWQLMGLEMPSSASTVSSKAGGSLSTSEFEFSYSYKDRGLAHESNASTSVSTRTLTSTGAMEIQVPNSTDAQTDAIVLYGRNKTAGETVLRKISSAAVQGGASSTYTIDSSNWSANAEAPTNHDIPLAFQYAVFWKNRWWAKHPTIGNRVHFTELFQPQSWPALFFIDFPFEKGDEATAFVPQGDTLIVFGQSKVYVIIGQTSLDFEVRPAASAQAGAFGPRAVETIEQGVLHAAAEGLFIFDGASDQLMTYDIDKGWRDLVRNASQATLATIAVVYEFKNKEVRVAVPRLYPRGVRGEWALDLSRTRDGDAPAWVNTDRDIRGYIQMDGDEPTAGNRGRLFSWPATGGYLFEESTGYSANGSNATAQYEGPHLSLGLHRARVLSIHGEYEPHGGAFTVETIVDDISQGSQAVPIGAGQAVYGTALYGTDAYAGSGRRMFYLTQPLSAEGRSVWIKASYVGQEAFRWFTYHPTIVPEPRPRSFGE